MTTVLKKESLKDGYYYSGYVLQNYTVIAEKQPMLVAMWDEKAMCFYLWEDDGNRRIKTKLSYLPDIDYEIEDGFYPIKQTIPKENQVID